MCSFVSFGFSDFPNFVVMIVLMFGWWFCCFEFRVISVLLGFVYLMFSCELYWRVWLFLRLVAFGLFCGLLV